jgi:purine-nucleoside phosphorylase
LDAEITSRQLESSIGFSGRLYVLRAHPEGDTPVSAADPASFSVRLDELERAVRQRTDLVPELGIVLGSGLGTLGDELESVVAIPFSELPGWPAASAPGHAGRLLFGTLEGLPVVCLQGRLHVYEGHSPRLVVEPVLLMGRLGAPRVLLTNAAGGVNAAFPAGTLMIIRDHVNMTGLQPLIGPNDDKLGPRFPDMVDAWSPRLRDLMRRAAADEGIAIEEGVYIGLTGPTYETPAEVVMLRTLGADAVGMSTVLEAVVARWAGMELVGVSLVTNAGAGVTGLPLSHEEVLETGREAGPRFTRLVKRFATLLKTA